MSLTLAGCAGGYDDDSDAGPAPIQVSALPAEHGTNHVESQAGQAALQCVPYAREHSAVKIYGDAYTWWDQAAEKYERGATPATGTVMVLHNYAGPTHGHVAVVRRVISGREIRVDHANWLDDGSIYVNDPVVDVSATNDWSAVKVWNIKTGGWGAKVYPVQGFIGSGSASVPDGSDAAPSSTPEAAPDLSDSVIAATPVAPRRLAAARSPIQPVAVGPDDLGPPAGSSHALTAQDLTIP